MASVPQDSTRSHLKSLKAGLAALKQGDLKTAIAYLERISPASAPQEAILQAQMGLVVAYHQRGHTDRSLALCRELSQSTNIQVQQWAMRTLNRWAMDRDPTINDRQPTIQPTGFVPFSPEAQQNLDTPVPQNTGFVPFSPEAQQNLDTPVVEATGWVPVEKSNPSPSPTPTFDRSTPEHPEPNLPIESLDEPPGEIPVATESVSSSSRKWRNSPRAARPKPLKGSRLGQLCWMQIGTVSTLFAFMLCIVQVLLEVTNEVLYSLPFSLPLGGFYHDPIRGLAIGFLLLTIASPWLLDFLLQFAYSQKPLSLKTLGNYSPEATQLLRQVCRQRKIAIPTLGVLPDTAPVIFTYGHLPATAHIVVSQGLLDQLKDDEIATLYAAELAHILYGDAAVLSLGLAITQIPYILYWKAAEIGDLLQEEAYNRDNNPYQFYSLKVAMWMFAVISAIAYGFYWLLRLPLLPLCRQRISESDRFATATTGNPNGFARSLLKLAIGIAKDVQQQQHTSYLLESFEGVMPISHRQAISLGSAYSHNKIEAFLAWDLGNPQRHWLTLNQTHPLLGERLAWLTRCAQFWKLEPEFDLTPPSSRRKSEPQRLWLQGAPFFGLMLALGVGIALTFVGWVSQSVSIWAMGWIFRDRTWLLPGLMLTGFSIGTLIRINPFFRDLTPTRETPIDDLLERLSHPLDLPLDSYTVQFSGKLLGRRGIANWLGQDLMVQTQGILVKLHCCSKFGPGGNLLPQTLRPSDGVGREATVIGWWRRGATTWIDVDTLKLDRRRTPANGHPIWSTLLVALTASAGVYLIAGGGL